MTCSDTHGEIAGDEVAVLFVLHVEGDVVAGIQAIRNPDKLAGLAARVDRDDAPSP